MGRYHYVRIALGCVLLATSALKANQLFSDGITEGAFARNHIPMVATSAIELVLGGFLLISRQETWTWRVAVVLFAFLGVIALRKFFAGDQSCSCLGTFDIPPSYTLGFDLIAVGALLVFRPAGMAWTRSIHGPISVGVGAVVTSCAFGAVQYGSVHAAVAYCQGYKLLPRPAALWLGKLVPEERVARRFMIKNPTNRVVTITGARPSCRCFVATKLPVVVPAGSTIEFAVGLQPSRESAGRTVVRDGSTLP